MSVNEFRTWLNRNAPNGEIVPWYVDLRKLASCSNVLVFAMVVIPVNWAATTWLLPTCTAETFATAPAPVAISPVDDALAGVLSARSSAALRRSVLAFENAGLEPIGSGPVLRRSGYDLTAFDAKFEKIESLVFQGFAQGRAADTVKLVNAAHRLARILARGVPGDRFLAYRNEATKVQGKLDDVVQFAGRKGWLTPSALRPLQAVYTEALARETGVAPAVLAQLEAMKSLIRRYDASVMWVRWLPCWPQATAAVDRGIAQCRAGQPVAWPRIDHPVIRARWDDFGAAARWHAKLLGKRQQLLADVTGALASETPRDARGL